MSSNKYLNCPFCGNKAFFDTALDGTLFAVMCSECGANSGYKQDKEKAISTWNNRINENNK